MKTKKIIKKRKISNSKAIGNAYERVIARRLSKWLSGSDKKLVCWRESGSGSVGTIMKKKNQDGSNIDSDIVCRDLKYQSFFNRFHIDSKSLTKINLFLTNKNNQKSNKLLNEWKKVINDAGEKYALMFVKVRDNKTLPDFIMCRRDTVINYNNCIEYNFQNYDYDAILITQEDFFENNIDWEIFVRNNRI